MKLLKSSLLASLVLMGALSSLASAATYEFRQVSKGVTVSGSGTGSDGGQVTPPDNTSGGGQQTPPPPPPEPKTFTSTHNGTVLTWHQPTAAPLTWQDLSTQCSALTVGGQTGWRMPTEGELSSMVSQKGANFLADQGWPVLAAEWYWTSSHWSGARWRVVKPLNNTSSVGFNNGTDAYQGACVK